MIPYFFKFSITFAFWGICWLIGIVLIGIFCLATRKTNISKYSMATLIWGTFSIFLPAYIKKHHLINPKWLSYILVLLSPACFFTIFIPSLFVYTVDLPCKCYILGSYGEKVSGKLISFHTNTSFPSMKFVKGGFQDAFPDFTNTCTMKLVEKPSESFVKSLKDSEKWQKNDNNPNVFYWSTGSELSTSYEFIEINIKTGEIHLEYIDL